MYNDPDQPSQHEADSIWAEDRFDPLAASRAEDAKAAEASTRKTWNADDWGAKISSSYAWALACLAIPDWATIRHLVNVDNRVKADKDPSPYNEFWVYEYAGWFMLMAMSARTVDGARYGCYYARKAIKAVDDRQPTSAHPPIVMQRIAGLTRLLKSIERDLDMIGGTPQKSLVGVQWQQYQKSYYGALLYVCTEEYMADHLWSVHW